MESNLFFTFRKMGQLQTLKLVGGSVVPSSSGLEGDISLASEIFKHFKPRTARMPVFSEQSLSKLTMPILMLFGDSDQLIPADKSIQRLKQFAQHANIELLPNTGHLIVNQTELILKFLNQKLG